MYFVFDGLVHCTGYGMGCSFSEVSGIILVYLSVRAYNLRYFVRIVCSLII